MVRQEAEPVAQEIHTDRREKRRKRRRKKRRIKSGIISFKGKKLMD